MKDFRWFDNSDFVVAVGFIKPVDKKRKVDNDFLGDGWIQNPGNEYIEVNKARRILGSLGTEQKMIPEDEKQQEIKRLMQTIKDPGDKL